MARFPLTYVATGLVSQTERVVPGATVSFYEVDGITPLGQTLWNQPTGGTGQANPTTTGANGATPTFWLDNAQAIVVSWVAPGWAGVTETVSVGGGTSSGTPTGSAGGDLTGTFPNPTVTNNAITSAKINTSAVGTTQLANLAVTTAKLNPAAVTTTELADNAVNSAKLASNAVTTAKIADGQVTAAKVGTDVATLTGGHVPATQLGSGTANSSTYLRGDQTYGAGTTGPVSSLTDVTVASIADGQVLAYHAGAGKWQNDTIPWRTFEFFGGSLTGTVTAQTTAWTAARTWSDAIGGGEVRFGIGTYQHMPKLELGNHMSIHGAGILATRLQFDSSITSGACVYNHVSTNGTTDPNAWGVRVQSMTLDCSQLPGWGTNAVNGITFNQNPQFSKATADSAEILAADTGHILRDVYIYQPPQDGAVAAAMGTQHWENVVCYSAGRYGLQPPFDCTVFNLTVGFSAKQGIVIQGHPVRLVGCKTFSCGNITHTSGQGYWIVPDGHGAGGQSGDSGIVLVNCEAQDNWDAGILVDGSLALVTLVGFLADSNSVRSAGAAPGIDILNSPKTQLIGCIANERNFNGNNQLHAVSLRGTSTGCHIEVQQTATGGATNGSPFGAIDSGSGASFASVNNLLGYQGLAFPGSLTPDFYAGGKIELTALTGNLTVNAPANGPYPPGTEVRFVLKQDATGGRTITWNGVYLNTPTTNTAANGYTIARFVYNGTSWLGV